VTAQVLSICAVQDRFVHRPRDVVGRASRSTSYAGPREAGRRPALATPSAGPHTARVGRASRSRPGRRPGLAKEARRDPCRVRRSGSAASGRHPTPKLWTRLRAFRPVGYDGVLSRSSLTLAVWSCELRLGSHAMAVAPERRMPRKGTGNCGHGPVAQLGARLNGIQEVTGSNPVRSTILRSREKSRGVSYGSASPGKDLCFAPHWLR
jgi:hypothetical protein